MKQTISRSPGKSRLAILATSGHNCGEFYFGIDIMVPLDTGHRPPQKMEDDFYENMNELDKVA